MPRLLITDTGELRDANSQALRRELLSPRPDFDFVAYVVRNLGFIGLHREARAHHVHMRPSVTSKVALTRLFQLLVEEQPARVVINLADEVAIDRIVGDSRRALVVIDRLISVAQDSLGEYFLSASRDVAGLDARDPLAGLLARWRACHGVAELQDIAALVGGALAKRYVVVEPPAQGGALMVRACGGGFPTYNVTRHVRGKALSIEHHQDFYYGKWVSQRYRGALARREPVLADVDALIARPQRGRQRWRYRHLLLPIRGRDGALRLLGASVFDPRIDLRVER